MYDPSDTAHVGWYYIPVQNGTATWMDPYLNANIDVYMISYVVPIFVDGVSVGIVGMDIDFGSIENLTGSVKIYDTGSAFLVNSGNQVVYHDEVAFGTAIADIEGSSLSALYAALWMPRRKAVRFVTAITGYRKSAVISRLQMV